MNNGPHPSTGRLGWLFAALLFGVLAGGGIAWALISRHTENPSVVIYQMPTPVASVPPDDFGDRAGNTPRHRRHTVRAAEDLPGFLEGAQATPEASSTPELAAGLDGSASGESTPAARQTVLVDGIALTQPSSPAPVAARSANRAVYDLNSTGVDDSLALAIEGIQKYLNGKGYTLREDSWGGDLAAGKAKTVSQQLYKGNDYWFCMGTATVGSTVRVRLYDSDGNAVDTNYWQHEQNDGSYAAAELQCQRSGTYFVVVSAEKTPEEHIPWGVVYAYR